MTLRELSLGPGWYPRQRDKIEEFLKPVLESGDFRSQDAFSAVAPHAGWYYSGLTAAIAVSSLDTRVETVAVIGGHLPKGMPVLVAQEEGVKTPLGIMEIDRELRKEFEGQLDIRPDNYNDNTVEVLIPMVHYFFPQAKLLWLRFPAELSSFE
ncbi:MAG: AmmeMemoRadiSam system protein B, partial [Treponema sp.]|nr:AmmeMemoRadiSam system protein B [Treponema sp.]